MFQLGALPQALPLYDKLAQKRWGSFASVRITFEQ